VNQLLGNRPAVDRYERTFGAPRLALQAARHHFLAGAAFPGDQHWRITCCQLADQFAQCLGRRALPDHQHIVDGARFGIRVAQAAHAERAAKGAVQTRDIDGQGMKIEEPLINEVGQAGAMAQVITHHRNPFAAAVMNQLFDTFKLGEVLRLQANNTNIVTGLYLITQVAALDQPAFAL